MKRITLHAARLKAGLTQEELEAKSGVRQGMISRLERKANARPSFATVIKLANALNIEAARLQFGRDQPESATS